MAIPERLIRILRTAETEADPRFPPTEVFNEGWMLRLLLDAIQTLAVEDHPLSFLPGSKWFSEALLNSPFRPRLRPDPLGEGFTNADAVIGQFDFRPMTRAGLSLANVCRQFVVVEAKMFSNLSAGTKNAPAYSQAARNVACMAETISLAGMTPADLSSVGFFVLAPEKSNRHNVSSNLEAATDPSAIRAAVDQRIAAYEAAGRVEAVKLRGFWEPRQFKPLLDRLSGSHGIAVLSWEDCIEWVSAVDAPTGDELRNFYKRCLELAPGLNTATVEPERGAT